MAKLAYPGTCVKAHYWKPKLVGQGGLLGEGSHPEALEKPDQFVLAVGALRAVTLGTVPLIVNPLGRERRRESFILPAGTRRLRKALTDALQLSPKVFGPRVSGCS